MDSEKSFVLHSITDLDSYNLPEDILFGSLRSTTEFTSFKLLGEGSSASVYSAKDTKKNKTFALKCLKPIKQAFELPKDIFREITILNSLDHDHIIKFHEIVLAPNLNNLCLVFDLCPYSLDRYIDCYPYDIPHCQVKGISKQILLGLDYLHKNYVIHRDLTPRNLMITGEGVIKIIDFGLSRKFTYQNKPTTPGICTRWYQAPEILFEAPSYDEKIDMWSASCIIAEMLTKKPFLPGESEIDQIVKIIDLIGSPTPNVWPGFNKCRIPKTMHLKSQPFNRLDERLQEFGGAQASDFLSGLFNYNPVTRKTAEECLSDDWFETAPFPSRNVELFEELSPILKITG